LVVDCGCGKTLAAILIALIKNKPVIVIAPTHRLCSQWKTDIEESVENADVWLYSKPEETKQGVQYQERFKKWLTT
jgi:superfamily II DNA or RNA helicase